MLNIPEEGGYGFGTLVDCASALSSGFSVSFVGEMSSCSYGIKRLLQLVFRNFDCLVCRSLVHNVSEESILY